MTSVNATNSGSTALLLLQQTRVSQLSATGNQIAPSSSLDAIFSKKDAAIAAIKRLAAAWEDKKASLAAAGDNARGRPLSVSQANAAYAENSGKRAADPALVALAASYPPELVKMLSCKSANTLISAKHCYDIAPQRIKCCESFIETLQGKLANTSDAESIAAINERISSLKISIEDQKNLILKFPDALLRFEQSVRSTYSLSGNFLTRNEDGSYDWGIFTVSNKVTGSFYYGHNGDGTIVEQDGIVQPFIVRKVS